MKKKVAFLVAGVNSGGTENYLLRFLKFYGEKIDATVYCKSGGFGELELEFKEVGAELKAFHLGYFNVVKFNKLKKEFELHKYDSVCDLTGSLGALPLLMAKRAGVPKRIAFFRNSREKFKKSFFKTRYYKFITNLLPQVATKVLSNSKEAFNYFYSIDWNKDDKFDVIYNGVSADQFISEHLNLRKELDIPKEAFVVGHVGRLNDQKNHETILKVALDLCKKDKNIYFVLCGKNVDVKYQLTVDKQNLTNRVLLLGMRRDINKVLNTLNCFYFPSLIEGQPNALIEALISGVPFVASNINPIKETIPAKFHKQLIDPLDSNSAKIKILEIKNNPNKKEAMNISNWAINYYNPDKLFYLVFDQL